MERKYEGENDMNKDATLEKLVQNEAIELLEDCGIYCNNNKLIDLLENTMMAGYDSLTNRVHILKDLTKSCLENTPKRYNLYVPNKSFGMGGVAAFVKQGDDYVLPDVDTHTQEMAKIAKEFELPFMFNSAKGKSNEYNDIKGLENIRKYYDGLVYLRMETQKGIEEAVNDGKVITTHSIMSSPLKVNTDKNIDLLIKSVESGANIYLTSMPISCLTGCSTLYGLVTQSYAEFLAGLVITQSLKPQTFVTNGAFPTAGDPSNGYLPHLGSIFHNIANITVSQVSELYGLPSIQSGCTISSKHHKPQEEGYTDYETERGYKLWNSFNGWHQVRHAFGFIDNLIAFDFDKFRRDCVSLQKILENNETYDNETQKITYDSEAYKAIKSGCYYDNFKDLNHTLKNMGIMDEKNK